MFSIDIRSREPIYEQLIKNVISLAASGVLSPDEPLPSVRALARDLGINPNTVQRAYRELEGKGIIYHAAGRGSFVAPAEGLSEAVAAQHLEALEKALREAVKAKIPRESVAALVERVYMEDKK